ncbi:MAG: DoxX family protein [Pseudomonadota bacterium]|jgi:putative oxidoreductase
MRVSRNSRLFIPYLERFYDSASYYSYPLIRFIAGVMMIPHGYSKLFVNLNGTVEFFKSVQLEPAYPLAIYIGSLEFFGGIFLAIGFLTRFVAIQLIGLLAVATFYIHLNNGFLWVKGGFEYPLFWLVVMIAIFFKGGERVSIDSSLPKEF